MTADEPAERKRLAKLLPGEDLVVSTSAPEALWTRLGREPYDLVVATDSAVPAPLDQSIGALQALPDAPELVVVQQREDAEERARFQRAGVLGVIDASLDDDTFRETLAALFERSANHSKQAAELERGARHLLSRGLLVRQPCDAAGARPGAKGRRQ